MSVITNTTFDEIQLGDSTQLTKIVTENMVLAFAHISGDVNPVHVDADYAATTPFKQQIAHGMLTGALVSAALAMQLPGPGTIYVSQDIRFRKPVFLNDEITATLTVTDKNDKRKFVTLACSVTNQDGIVVAKGEAVVVAPTQKLSLQRPELPTVKLC